MNTDNRHIYSIKCIAMVIGTVFAIFVSLTLFASQANADETTNVESGSTSATRDYCYMDRLYNRWTGEHFYTANSDEKNELVKAGWKYEGTAWIAPTKQTLLFIAFITRT